MLTSSMYEGSGSFASGSTSNDYHGNNRASARNESVDSSPSTLHGEDNDHVAPPSYPPPAMTASTTFPPPPVRIVETSTADWGMMVVDENSNHGDNFPNSHEEGNSSHRNDKFLAEEDDYELIQGGVLILDGVSSTGGGEQEEEPDVSLSVPDSDNIPSDPGTIHGNVGGGGGGGGNLGGMADRGTTDRYNSSNWEHLISDDEEEEQEEERRYYGRRTLTGLYPFVCQVVRNAGSALSGIFRPANDDDDEDEGASFISTPSRALVFLQSPGVVLFAVGVVVLFLPGYSYYRLVQASRNHEAQWKYLQEENARLQLQEETLRKEMELLQEEAAAAMAKASSLLHEHEKWKLLNEAMADDGNDNKDFYFFEPDDCDKDSITLVDNCWLKAKANVQLGDCGDGTRDFFKSLWSSLWSFPHYLSTEAFADCGYAFPDESPSHFAMEPYSSSPCSPSDTDEECRMKSEQSAYTVEQDPLSTVFTAIQTAGRSFSERLLRLMDDEATHTRNTAADLEHTIQKGFSETILAISDVMDTTKKDIQALSHDVLKTLKAAVPRSHTVEEDTASQNQASTPQSVTRKGLFDAANALSSLSKTWDAAVASMVVSSTYEDDSTEQSQGK